jgi:general stress protein 26
MSEHNDQPKSLAELVSEGTTAMVGTETDIGSGLEFRPLTVAAIEADTLVYLVDGTAEWTRNLTTGTDVLTTIAMDRDNTFMWLAGTARVTDDDARIDELWNPFADAYFEGGRDHSAILVVSVEHDRGQYWTGPSGRIGSLVSFLKAKFGGSESAGEHGSLAV